MWVDIVFFAVIIVFALIGLWKGLFDSLLSLISTGVCLGIAIWLAKPCASFINNTIKLDVPKLIDGLVGKMTKETSFELFGMTFTRGQISGFLSMVFAGLIVFVLLKLGIYLLAKLFDSITTNDSALSGLNRLFGLFFGLLKGGVIVLVALSLCTVFSRFTEIETHIKKSTVTNWVYNYVDDFTEKQLKDIDVQEIIQDVMKKSDVDSKPATNTTTPSTQEGSTNN